MKRTLLLSICVCLSLPTVVVPAPPSTTPQNQPNPVETLIRSSLKSINEEKYQDAYDAAKQALTMSRRRNEKGRQARAANLLAIASLHLGRTNEAIRYFKQASDAADEAPGEQVRKLEVTALVKAGDLLRVSGRYQDALFCFTRLLERCRQQNNKQGEATALGRLGAIYSDTGDFAKADQHLQEALALARGLGDQTLEATVLVRQMVLEKERGNPEAALTLGQHILLSKLVRVPAVLEGYYQLGMVHAALQQFPKSSEIFERALERAREIGVPIYESLIQGELAWTQFKLGHSASALESASQALMKLRKAGGNKHLEAKFLSTLAEIQASLGRNEEALASYRLAITTLEQARSLSVSTEMSRAGIVLTRQKVFTGAIEFLLKEKRTAEALDVAESYHARAFMDVLTESRIDSLDELTQQQQEREDKLSERIAAIQKELWQSDASSETGQQLKARLADAENDLDVFRLELRRSNPRYASVESPPPIKSENISKELLDAKTALIEFVLSEQKSFAWVVRQNSITSVSLPPRKELEAAITEYRGLLSEKVSSLTVAQAVTKLKTKGRDLYQKLIQPLEPHLSPAQKLIIVPDGALAYLPFETLPVESKPAAGQKPLPAKFLLERFAIGYAPSASALVALNATRKESLDTKGIVAFGDPQYESASKPDNQTERGLDFRRLPYTRTEVSEIAALFPSVETRIFLGADANEEKLKVEDLSRVRYLHLAAHGMVDEEYPTRSGIVLSPMTGSKEDGALQVSEIMRLKLNADLVTLSACRTGLGKLLNGEGIIGLTRAFLYAGSDSVVVSLWNVNDIATAALMKGFYKNLQSGLKKDDALRQAKLDLLHGQQQAWRHPYYWAAFVLVGKHR